MLRLCLPLRHCCWWITSTSRQVRHEGWKACGKGDVCSRKQQASKAGMFLVDDDSWTTPYFDSNDLKSETALFA